MPLQYFKRFRMEFDLLQDAVVPPELPPGYVWTPWQRGDEDRHALVKYHSFRDEIDATVFDCLGDYQGCFQLMKEIAQQPGFLPDATWLITAIGDDVDHVGEDCGTIQGVAITETTGSIQNVGIKPDHRGLGLGRTLVLKSLAGFQAAGLKRVCLEVTAPNLSAVELYRRLGFTMTRTLFRHLDCAAHNG